MALVAGDKRWRSQAGAEALEWRRGKGAPHPSLGANSTMWLRLRAAFGVSAKADVLAFLLGIHGSKVGVREMADACGYSVPAVRVAAEDLARGRFIRRVPQRPIEYYVYPDPWTEILEVDVLPEWRFWVETFAFVAEANDWAQSALRADVPDRVSASLARDLVERHLSVMHLETLPSRDPRGFRGSEIVRGLYEMVSTTANWAKESV